MTYWAPRANLEYYAVVRRILDGLGPLDSILDVGCYDTPVATWGQFRERWTVDAMTRPEWAGVTAIAGRWPDCRGLPAEVDVVTCLQVLEHLVDPRSFARPLFESARLAVIISVPWGWPAGIEPSHRQDPVTAERLLEWTGREPTTLEIVGRPARAVAVYLAACGRSETRAT